MHRSWTNLRLCTVVLPLTALIAVSGCQSASTTSGNNEATGPRFVELTDDAQLLMDLAETEAMVVGYSGTCVEAWLESEVVASDETATESFKSVPVAISRQSCAWAESADDIRGQIIISGDLGRSPRIRIVVRDPASGKIRTSKSNQTMPMPKPPAGLTEQMSIKGKSRPGWSWLCPDDPPGDGQEFTIAENLRQLIRIDASGEDPAIEVVRSITLRLKGRLLPLAAPEPTSNEKQAVQDLQALGARVFLEGYQGDYYEGTANGSARRVSFRNRLDLSEKPELQDSDVAPLAQLKAVENVDFFGTKLGDGALEHVQGLEQLRELNLWQTPVTDKGLECLAGLTNLENLDLQGTQISDQGLRHLSNLSLLRSLRLLETNITADGLQHIEGLSNLEFLHLHRTLVDDSSAKSLAALSNLRELFLGHTRITDEGLKQIGTLKNLRWLSLSSTSVTDSGLAHLYGLASLELLNVGNTNVTDEGVAKLKEALPTCQVLR